MEEIDEDSAELDNIGGNRESQLLYEKREKKTARLMKVRDKIREILSKNIEMVNNLTNDSEEFHGGWKVLRQRTDKQANGPKVAESILATI